MVESVETGDDGQAISQARGHANADRRTGRGAMAPLWRSMLSKSSPLYRSSLFSFSLWESQLQERELALLRRQVERERRALQHRIEKLSKELQQKDKLIESLRSKLQEQPTAAPATSSPSPSGDPDQLERASFGMDDQGSTNEDLDLSLELDNVSEFGQENVVDDSVPPAPSHPYPSNPPSVASSHGHQSSSSCRSLHCAPSRLVDGQTELTSAPLPPSPQCLPAQMAFQPFNPQTQHPRLRSSTTGGFSLAEVHQELQRLQRQLANSFTGAQVKHLPAVVQPPDHTDFHLPSQHAFQRSLFASSNMIHGSQQKTGNVYNDVSSSSSGYQSGTRHTGTHLMEEHLREIRSLHRRLEESIQTNERLRQQLAERLGSKIQDGGAPTNIYIQGLDSVSQLANEVGVLREENQALQSQLQQASREAQQFRDSVLLDHTRLRQAELEVEKWAGQFRQLQVQLREQTQVVLQLKQDKQMSQENANRLQHEVNVLQQQLSESRRLVQALQCELQIYQRMRGHTHNDSQDVQEMPSHMHSLDQNLSDRLQLEVLHLSARKRLFQDAPRSPPIRDAGLVNPAASVSDQLQFWVPGEELLRAGNHVIGHWDDFSVLQQQLLEGKVLICKMEAALQNSVQITLHEGRVSNMLSSTKTLKQILEEMCSVLKMFWRAALPSAVTKTPQHHKEQTLTEEVVSLREKFAEQEKTLRDTLETLRDSNRTKDSIEQLIFGQLSRTRDVLKKARTNLEKNKLRINSLGCSFSPPSSQSISFPASCAARGEVSKPGCSSSPRPRIVTTPARHPHKDLSWVVQCVGTQRPLQTFSNSARSTLHTVAPTTS